MKIENKLLTYIFIIKIWFITFPGSKVRYYQLCLYTISANCLLEQFAQWLIGSYNRQFKAIMGEMTRSLTYFKIEKSIELHTYLWIVCIETQSWPLIPNKIDHCNLRLYMTRNTHPSWKVETFLSGRWKKQAVQARSQTRIEGGAEPQKVAFWT